VDEPIERESMRETAPGWTREKGGHARIGFLGREPSNADVSVRRFERLVATLSSASCPLLAPPGAVPIKELSCQGDTGVAFLEEPDDSQTFGHDVFSGADDLVEMGYPSLSPMVEALQRDFASKYLSSDKDEEIVAGNGGNGGNYYLFNRRWASTTTAQTGMPASHIALLQRPRRIPGLWLGRDTALGALVRRYDITVVSGGVALGRALADELRRWSCEDLGVGDVATLSLSSVPLLSSLVGPDGERFAGVEHELGLEGGLKEPELWVEACADQTNTMLECDHFASVVHSIALSASGTSDPCLGGGLVSKVPASLPSEAVHDVINDGDGLISVHERAMVSMISAVNAGLVASVAGGDRADAADTLGRAMATLSAGGSGVAATASLPPPARLSALTGVRGPSAGHNGPVAARQSAEIADATARNASSQACPDLESLLNTGVASVRTDQGARAAATWLIAAGIPPLPVAGSGVAGRGAGALPVPTAGGQGSLPWGPVGAGLTLGSNVRGMGPVPFALLRRAWQAAGELRARNALDAIQDAFIASSTSGDAASAAWVLFSLALVELASDASSRLSAEKLHAAPPPHCGGLTHSILARAFHRALEAGQPRLRCRVGSLLRLGPLPRLRPADSVEVIPDSLTMDPVASTGSGGLHMAPSLSRFLDVGKLPSSSSAAAPKGGPHQQPVHTASIVSVPLEGMGPFGSLPFTFEEEQSRVQEDARYRGLLLRQRGFPKTGAALAKGVDSPDLVRITTALGIRTTAVMGVCQALLGGGVASDATEASMVSLRACSILAQQGLASHRAEACTQWSSVRVAWTHALEEGLRMNSMSNHHRRSVFGAVLPSFYAQIRCQLLLEDARFAVANAEPARAKDLAARALWMTGSEFDPASAGQVSSNLLSEPLQASWLLPARVDACCLVASTLLHEQSPLEGRMTRGGQWTGPMVLGASLGSGTSSSDAREWVDAAWTVVRKCPSLTRAIAPAVARCEASVHAAQGNWRDATETMRSWEARARRALSGLESALWQLSLAHCEVLSTAEARPTSVMDAVESCDRELLIRRLNDIERGLTSSAAPLSLTTVMRAKAFALSLDRASRDDAEMVARDMFEVLRMPPPRIVT
jgi:hypothetical protein